MAIEVKNISYTYPGSTVTAVENVSMKIEKGERVAIIGQNGAGKSTTVKLMNNIYKPTSGKIIIDGINTKDQTTAQTAPHVGYVFQNPNDQIFNDDVIKVRLQTKNQSQPNDLNICKGKRINKAKNE